MNGENIMEIDIICSIRRNRKSPLEDLGGGYLCLDVKEPQIGKVYTKYYSLRPEEPVGSKLDEFIKDYIKDCEKIANASY